MLGKMLDNWDADLHFKATVHLRVGKDQANTYNTVWQVQKWGGGV